MSAQESLFSFDVQVYGPNRPDRHAGVMSAYVVNGESAELVANTEAARWAHDFQATTVGVWAQDRKSGHAQAKVPK